MVGPCQDPPKEIFSVDKSEQYNHFYGPEEVMKMTDEELIDMLRNNVGVSEAACRAAKKAANRIEELVTIKDALAAALRDLRGAVCGEDGFAQCVRDHSGTAYPWPALDFAEEAATAALAAYEGRK